MIKDGNNNQIQLNIRDNDSMTLISENQNLFDEINTLHPQTNSKNTQNKTNKINFKNEENAKDDSDNNKEKCFYLKIDSKYYFTEFSEKQTEIIQEKISQLKLRYDKNKTKSLNSISTKFIEKIVPSFKEIEKFSLSLAISQYICNPKKIENTIENNVNYFYDVRREMEYSNTFIMNVKAIKNLGIILCYAYSKLIHYNIKELGTLKFLIDQSKNEIMNILSNFYQYCDFIGQPPDDVVKTKYWENPKKRLFKVPGVLLFLNHLFLQITTIIIDINYLDESFNKDDVLLFLVIIMNLDIFINQIKTIKINLSHKKLENDIYNDYYYNILSWKLSMISQTTKTNIIMSKIDSFDEKWNFKYNFILQEHRLSKYLKENKTVEETSFNDFTIIEDEKSKMFVSSLIKNKANNSLPGLNSSSYYIRQFSLKDFDLYEDDDEDNDNNDDNNNNNNENRKSYIVYNNDQKTNNQNKNILIKYNTKKRCSVNNNLNINRKKEDSVYGLLLKNKSTFDLIMIILMCLPNPGKKFNKLYFIMNDSYTNEFIQYFKEKYHIKAKVIDNDFHILDFFVEKGNSLSEMNMEINSLDISTFERILILLKINSLIKSLKLSLFSSDITYTPQYLFKLYYQMKGEKNLNEIKGPFEYAVLDYIYPDFLVNLLCLFSIIKEKLSLINLGINLDIPTILVNKQNYMMVILKFILNMLLLINDKSKKLKKMTLLSPLTVLDGRMSDNIDQLLSNIDYEKNNIYLNELSIQFQIFNIHNITNLVSRNLVILNIGDLDLLSFEYLINYMLSYKFAEKSLLSQVRISLQKNINVFSPKLKVLFRNLFTIKLKNLKKLHLYTNVIIKKEKEYSYIRKILKNNWISSYTITFNDKSKNLIKSFLNKNKVFDYDSIYYFVPHNLENEFLSEEVNIKNIYTCKDDTIYWFLKYLFNHRYYYLSKNFNNNKSYIYNILKYLYFQKKVKINHFLEDETEEENNDEINDN